MLLVEPYKSEILPHWRFRTPAAAHGRPLAPKEPDAEELESAKIFRQRLDTVLSDPAYAAMREEHKLRHESSTRAAGKAPAAARRKRR